MPHMPRTRHTPLEKNIILLLGWAEKNWTGRFGPKYIFGALNIPMPILIVIYALIYGYFTENKKNIELAQNVSGQPWAKEKTSLWAGLGHENIPWAGLGRARIFFCGLGWAGQEKFFVGWAGLGQPKVLPAQTAQGAQMPTMFENVQ